MLKFSYFGWGYLACTSSGEQTNRSACLEHFSCSIDKASFKSNSMSQGHVLSERLFTWTHTQTPQSDAMSADRQVSPRNEVLIEEMNTRVIPRSHLSLLESELQLSRLVYLHLWFDQVRSTLYLGRASLV